MQSKLLESYFGEDGLQYTLGRIPMVRFVSFEIVFINISQAACDFSLSEYSYDDYSGDFSLSNFSIARDITSGLICFFDAR